MQQTIDIPSDGGMICPAQTPATITINAIECYLPGGQTFTTMPNPQCN